MTAMVERPVVAGPTRSWWLIVAMPLGPFAVGLLRYLLPYTNGDDLSGMVQGVAANPGRQSAVLWLGLVAVLTLVPGVQAAARLAGPGRLTTVAVAMVVPAYLCLGGLLVPDLIAWSGVQAGIDQTALVKILETAHPTVAIYQAMFVIGHVVGTVLLGLALLRSGRVPAWAAWALAVSQPLHFVAAVILGSHELDLFAWSLAAVGMAVAASRIVRTYADIDAPAVAR